MKILIELDWISLEIYVICLGCVYGFYNLDRKIFDSIFEGIFLNVNNLFVWNFLIN